MGNYIAVDIGGTFIKYGIISDKGKVLKKFAVSTQASQGAAAVLGKVKDAIKFLLDQAVAIQGIGISTAGVVDTDQGVIQYANENLPGYTGTRIKEIIENEFNLPVTVNNDVNAMALAEQWLGAGAGRKTFFCMTIGTGIGGAIVIDGKLYKGRHFRAAEIGYLNKTGKTNFEKRASAAALVELVKKELQTEDSLDGVGIFSRIKAGDPICVKIFDSWVAELCKGIANVICLFDPELIIIGGGVSEQKEYLIDKIRCALANFLPTAFLDGIAITGAQCENDAGLVGAVYEFVKKR